ncbi:hypothetical protein CDQ84_02070 [Clostridium thermosuccinogenes]|mgnify:FL=1|uniref:Uncharacterized protein n=1 Tax=Clostridium thermosuccinogenes TaxID=84032 RepID=A0A2K2F0W1_9CLOT|nr:hypothetical protein [Pseudoclostridium thermosuccinogenes]AUS96910.1 hypothetical protein CDO33_10990 [Pseudoclostridium thermosuccinogenes]PNT92421.1 hypothetical protein CDQ83_02250 [Pseudoclostridium thermosuccinogenes]PNT99673.1 hypothetical protein CDQ85_02265 [Pseudoclostridium thermosuccinogenes]PNU01193.1 hypothetical protein CDQ84_02070 [Pseudoclostridium thermosuccinogenes]
MKDYSYSELGMLIGAAVGGILSILGFSATKKPLFFLLAAVGIFTGVIIGKNMDRNSSYAKSDKNDANHKFF